MIGEFVMPFIDFELLVYWQIVKDRRYPIGFNKEAVCAATRSRVPLPVL